MNDNPYAKAPDFQRWSKAIAQTPSGDVDPLTRVPFQIACSDTIVSAGSCFAQHIGRRLLQNGFSYLVTETAHPLLPKDIADSFGYGLYSARYGNIYTTRQLLQLLRRAYGRFRPNDDVWQDNGRYYDPFRPTIQAKGFATRREYDLDRQQHFAAVRRAFETMNVFIFTLGLTECWQSIEDGAVYPMCPGTVAGHFDPTQHAFLNLSAAEVIADMRAFVAEVRALNPKVRVVLTVSPVPLAATAVEQHVLLSTVYSKSVLRVAAEEIARLPDAMYFPAYEIVTGSFSRGRYFGDDCRAVTEEGVSHVMRVFFKHLAPDGRAIETAEPTVDPHVEHAHAVAAAICDEERLDRR